MLTESVKFSFKIVWQEDAQIALVEGGGLPNLGEFLPSMQSHFPSLSTITPTPFFSFGQVNISGLSLQPFFFTAKPFLLQELSALAVLILDSHRSHFQSYNACMSQ